MEPFYITFRNKANNSGNHPYDMEMNKIGDKEEAEAYIVSFLNSIISHEDYRDLPECQPIIITNDKALWFKYKHVLNYNEFKWYCGFYESYEKLPYDAKQFVSSGLAGYGVRTFEYFEKLLAGKGMKAYQYFRKESFYDEDNGNKYVIETEDGWKIQ